MKPKWSTVVIARNEEKTLPKLLASLEEFKARGGETVILDTGSTDKTVEIAKAWGAKVEEVGEIYRHEISEDLARQINERFIVDGEEDVVKAGEHYFDFSSARNHVTSLASNDMCSFADCDEAFTKLDIDAINKLIDDGHGQFEYNFVFAHDANGGEAVKFVQSKFHDRTKLKWVNLVHEVLSGAAKRTFLPENIFKLEHWQNHETNRHSYLVGLAVDCFNRQEDDRNSHYFARELFWSGRYKSAMKEFERHIAMDRWPAEKAESMIYIGDCLGRLNRPAEQPEWYQRAYNIDGGRRKALLRLAGYYKFMNDAQRTAVYAAGALEVPMNGYYANDVNEYKQVPHEFLYWAKGWLGDIPGARHHLLEALRYKPFDPIILSHTKYYFEYPHQNIDGWMSFEECQWLYETAKEMRNVVELGSWKGRSTHALASGCKGNVTAVDHWQGSKDVIDSTNWMAKKEDVYQTFLNNVKDRPNITPMRMSGDEAAEILEPKSFDMVFVDAGHTYEEVKNDIAKWLPKARKIMSGDDYLPGTWMGVVQAVDEVFGKPDGVVGKVWWVDITKRDPNDPKTHI